MNQSAEVEQVTRDELIDQIMQGDTGVVFMIPQSNISHTMVLIKATSDNSCSMQVVEKDTVHTLREMNFSAKDLIVNQLELDQHYAFCYVLPKSEQIMNGVDMQDEKYLFDMFYTIMDSVNTRQTQSCSCATHCNC